MNDWQKERQFKVLNEKKEERGVKVIWDDVEKVVDIKVRPQRPYRAHTYSFHCRKLESETSRSSSLVKSCPVTVFSCRDTT